MCELCARLRVGPDFSGWQEPWGVYNVLEGACEIGGEDLMGERGVDIGGIGNELYESYG